MTKDLSSQNSGHGLRTVPGHGGREDAVSSTHEVLSLVQFGGCRQSLPGAKHASHLLLDTLDRCENWILLLQVTTMLTRQLESQKSVREGDEEV